MPARWVGIFYCFTLVQFDNVKIPLLNDVG